MRGSERRAVLVLHGFTGSPWEVRPLGEALAARGFHVEAPLLPGHGGAPEALGFVTWRDWVASAEGALASLLARFGEVSVAGLSMGALLGLVLAARCPQVRRLVLLAPVVRLKDPTARLVRKVRHTRLVPLLPTWLDKKSSDIELPEVRAQAPLLPRYPLARVFDLFELQDLARLSEPGVRCPVLVVGAMRDQVVDFEEVCALHSRLGNSRLLVLQHGAHLIPRDVDRALALSEVGEFLDA